MYFITIPSDFWRGKQTAKASHRLKLHVTQLAYQKVMSAHHGDIDAPNSWLPVAWGLHCDTDGEMVPYGVPDFFRGRYTPYDPETFNGTGLIEYNTALPPPQQARVLVHEIGHHLFWPILTGSLFGAQIKCSYDDDPMNFREDCCHLLVEMVYGEFPQEAGVSQLLLRYGKS